MKKENEQSIFKNKTYMRMLSAYSISIFGDWFDMIAIAVLISYTWNTDPILIGLVPISYALPGILFGSVAGVLADRWRKLNVMIVADLLSALLTFCILFATNIYLLLPILMLRSTIGLLNSPAQQALTRHVVDEKLLLKATSINQMVNQFGKVIGPLLGAAILTLVSPMLCIIINAISSLFSASILLTLRNIKENQHADIEEKEEQKKPTFKQSWKEGWGFVFKNKVIFHSMMFGLIGFLVIQMVDFQFPVVLREIVPGEPSAVGWLIAASGLGAILSMTFMNKLESFQYGWVLGGGYFLIGIGFGGIGFLPVGVSLLWPTLLGFIAGVGNGIWMVGYNFILQTESSKEMVGRVFGINNSLGSIAVIVAPLTGGALIQVFGPSEIYQIIGIGVAIVGLSGVLLQKLIWSFRKENKRSEINVVASEI